MLKRNMSIQTRKNKLVMLGMIKNPPKEERRQRSLSNTKKKSQKSDENEDME